MRSFLLPLIFLALASCTQKKGRHYAVQSANHTKDSVTGVFPADTVLKKTPEKNNGNDTIMPGKAVGRITLNEKVTDLYKTLGEPDSADAAMGKALLSWFAKPVIKDGDTTVNSVRVFTHTNFGSKEESPRVKLIRITSPFFKTESRVGTGSTLAFIKMQYPTIKKWASYEMAADKPVVIYADMKEGISFEIGGTTKCVGIAVHHPNEVAWELYNAIFGPLKKL